MAFEFFIGRRYLKAKRKQSFISLITVLSVAGVAVGVMALIVVIAVMTGFEKDLKERILGGQSHVVVLRHGGKIDRYQNVMARLAGMPHIEAVSPFVYSQVMIRSASGISGAILRGVDPATASQVIPKLKKLPLNPPTPALEESDPKKRHLPQIVLGEELAKGLNVLIGDRIYLISPRGMLSPVGHMPAMRQFKVVGYYKSGMYEYDSSFAYVPLESAQQLLRLGEGVTGIDVRVDEIYKADVVAENIISMLGFPFWAKDWMSMNKNLFAALKLEKAVMFVILTLIVLVAAFNIASTLIMMVMEKTRDIAILKAMGATGKSIRKIFVFNGMVIGSVGTLLGTIGGFVLCEILQRYKIVELTGDIYYFTTNLPVRMQWLDVTMIDTAALMICFLATLYPANQASKMDPVEAIRYG